MSLPNLPYEDTLRREVRTEWGGLNLNENAGDGELIEAMNMSSREYPLLATAAKPRLIRTAAYMGAPVLYDELYWVERKTGTNKYYFVNGTTAGTYAADLELGIATVTAVNSLRYALIGKRIYMFPIKKYYDIRQSKVKDMEASVSLESVGPYYDEIAYFQDGTFAGVFAEWNTIYAPGADWASKFKVGDAVDIGITQTAVIREIEGDYLRFYENTFQDKAPEENTGFAHLVLDSNLSAGTYHYTKYGQNWNVQLPALPSGTVLEIDMNPEDDFVSWGLNLSAEATAGDPEGDELVFYRYAGAHILTVERLVPDMDYVCVNENRLWGCKGDTIYASKLGDPLNFNVFDGLSTDSWAVDTGTPGDFTGCASYQGYPTFFKANAVFRILGDTPSNYMLRMQNVVGVAPYSDLSLVEVRGKLYYESPAGIVTWNGGDYPDIISLPLDIDYFDSAVDTGGTYLRKWSGGHAGTDGLRYYISLFYKRKNGSTTEYKARMMVYDTRFGTWHEQQDGSYTARTRFAWDGINLYAVISSMVNNARQDTQYRLPGDEDPSAEQDWTVTFAESTRAYKTVLTGSEAKKGVLRLLIRCRLAGTMKVWIAYDGGDFEEVKTIGGDDEPKNTYVVPLILRRCDRWQLRLTGTQTAVIYSIAVERYAGEWQQAE